jgi:hypothetical protein
VTPGSEANPYRPTLVLTGPRELVPTVDAGSYQTFVIPGLILILLGIILIAIPFLAKVSPSIEKLPTLLVWVYRSDGFYFVTSPILIIISVISIIVYLVKLHS